MLEIIKDEKGNLTVTGNCSDLGELRYQCEEVLDHMFDCAKTYIDVISDRTDHLTYITKSVTVRLIPDKKIIDKYFASKKKMPIEKK